MRYGAGILKWTTDELKNIDRKPRKVVMAKHGALYTRNNTERLYLTREKGGRGLIRCEGCVRVIDSRCWLAEVVGAEGVVSRNESKRI